MPMSLPTLILTAVGVASISALAYFGFTSARAVRKKDQPPMEKPQLEDTQPMPAIRDFDAEYQAVMDRLAKHRHVYGYDEDGNRSTHPFKHLPEDSSWWSSKPAE